MYKLCNNKKFCPKDHFSSTSFSLPVLVLLRDGYFVILSGERGKHWVLGEKGGIFMRRHRRRRRFGGNSQQQWDRWSGTGWEVTAVQSTGIREKNSMEYPVYTNKFEKSFLWVIWKYLNMCSKIRCHVANLFPTNRKLDLRGALGEFESCCLFFGWQILIFVLSIIICCPAKWTGAYFCSKQRKLGLGSQRKDLGSLSFAIDNKGGDWAETRWHVSD